MRILSLPRRVESVNGRCRMCRKRPVELEEGELCGDCVYGSQRVFRYECNRCHQTQRIPHPIWRSMKTPRDFSEWSWACHVSCYDFTHWKLVSDDVGLVPERDIPQSWLDDRESTKTQSESPRLEESQTASYASKCKSKT